MKKIILVAGATGNLGGKIVDALLKNGEEVQLSVKLWYSHQTHNAKAKSNIAFALCLVEY